MSLELCFQADPLAEQFSWIQLQYGVAHQVLELLVAITSPDAILWPGLPVLEDASTWQKVPGHGAKSQCTIKHSQGQEGGSWLLVFDILGVVPKWS